MHLGYGGPPGRPQLVNSVSESLLLPVIRESCHVSPGKMRLCAGLFMSLDSIVSCLSSCGSAGEQKLNFTSAQSMNWWLLPTNTNLSLAVIEEVMEQISDAGGWQNHIHTCWWTFAFQISLAQQLQPQAPVLGPL